MLIIFGLKPRTGRQLFAGLFVVLAVWGAQVSAADEGTPTPDGHNMEHMSGMVHSEDHPMSHDMSASEVTGDEHAAHHQMMHRHGYTRTVHDYTAPAFSLFDQRGRVTSMTEQLDTQEPVMLNFIFTTCTTICPVLSATFSQIQEALGSESASVRMISVSIDPQQDTPERLLAYAERFEAGPQWRFLTGEVDNIVAVQKAFDIYRGSKTNHEPITLLRGPGESQWLRIDGIASASDIVDEYRALSMAKH